jgi:hypothetical protein
MSQVWHAVGRDRKPLRRRYLEAILPPFVAVLRRWRPLLAGIHELATADGLNPLIVDDRALAADALPIEVIQDCLSFYSILSCSGFMAAKVLVQYFLVLTMICFWP